MVNLRAIKVAHRKDGVILIPLPRELWVWPDPEGFLTCSCHYCSDDPQRSVKAAWDTLVVSPESDHTWMVHAPELHGAKKKR